MNKISTIILSTFMMLSATLLSASEQNLRIFSVDNKSGKITAKTVQKSFAKVGVIVDVNNDMNSIFSKRYGKIHHKKYNLAIFTNDKLVKKLMNKYPSIGMITPLTMSIYVDAKNNINITTLTLDGMSRITKIPATNKDLMAYASLVDKALHKALPNGKYLKVNHDAKAKFSVTEFTMELELEDGDTYTDAKESFEEEFESEISPVGFLVPKKYVFDHEAYDFFDTYSIIRFNAIYPVQANHPDAGAYAPFSVVMYKKKGDDNMHIAYPSISNWVTDLDIKDEATVKAVNETQGMIVDILTELTE